MNLKEGLGIKKGLNFYLLTMGFFFLNFLSSLSAYQYSSGFLDRGLNSIYSPSDLWRNEWVIFTAIFLVLFTITFMSLSNFFSKKKVERPSYWEKKEIKVLENKSAIVVISLAVALLGAISITRSEYFSRFIGEAMASWVLLLVLIVIILITIPFFKALSKNIGFGPALVIFVLIIWFVLKYFLNPYEMNFYYDIPVGILDVYDFVTSLPVLIISLIVSVVFAIIRHNVKKSN